MPHSSCPGCWNSSMTEVKVVSFQAKHGECITNFAPVSCLKLNDVTRPDGIKCY